MKYRILFSSLFILCILFGCAVGPRKPVLRKIPRSERSDLVVLNFRNDTAKNRAKEFQPWELGLASMMMTDLESIGLFNIISSKDVTDVSRNRGLRIAGIETEADTLEVGKLVSAKYALTGSFVEMGGELRMEARVFLVEKGMQLGAASVMGKTETFFDLEKQLVIKILKYLEAALNDEETSKIAENIETRSINASLNNYAGEIKVIRADELKERGEIKEADKELQEAKKNFKTALKHDPNYKRAKRNLAKLVMGMPMTI